MLALFSFVRANENVSGPREWTPAQFEEIQLHAMSCLCALVPMMIEEYMTCQGSTRLLLLLEWCVGEGGSQSLSSMCILLPYHKLFSYIPLCRD